MEEGENLQGNNIESGGSKKRKKFGRISEVRKKINLMSHITGPACNCILKCFDRVDVITRKQIIQNFNLMHSSDEQDVIFVA